MSRADTTADPYADKRPWSIGGRNYVLVLLTLVGAINFVDRQILTVLLEDIKAEFGLADWMLGVITGFGFAVFYATLGIPIAALSDRFNRRNIIVICTSLFSVMTAICGMVQNVWQLFFARIGVGVGEAGTMPASQSMLSNLFPIENRAAAMGLLATSGNIGLMLGLLVGGWVNEWIGWRWAFGVAAMPGVLLALAIWFTVKEPKRPPLKGPQAPMLSDTIKGIGQMVRMRSMRWFVLGGSFYGMSAYGIHTFMPSYYMRFHDMNSGEAGTVNAIIVGVLGAFGAFGGGVVCGKIASRYGLKWNGLVPALGIGISVPLLTLMLLTDNTWAAIGLFIVPGILSSIHAGPTWAIIQELVPPNKRAMAASVFMLLYNLIGLGLGPAAVGGISSAIEPWAGDQSLRYAMAGVLAVSLFGIVAYILASRSVEEDVARVRAAG